MPGGILDVVARGLHQPRHLAQLRHDPAGAFGQRRVGEQRLAGQAGGEDVGGAWAALAPRCAPLRARRGAPGCWRRAPVAQAAGCWSPRRVDGGEPSRESAELANLRVNRRPPRSSIWVGHSGGHRRMSHSLDRASSGADIVRECSSRVRLNTCSKIWHSQDPASSMLSRHRSATSGGRYSGDPRAAGSGSDRRRGHQQDRSAPPTYSISTPTTSLHEHNQRTRTPSLINRLTRGDSIAFISPMPFPDIDPGALLVARGPRRRRSASSRCPGRQLLWRRSPPPGSRRSRCCWFPLYGLLPESAETNQNGCCSKRRIGFAPRWIPWQFFASRVVADRDVS